MCFLVIAGGDVGNHTPGSMPYSDLVDYLGILCLSSTSLYSSLI